MKHNISIIRPKVNGQPMLITVDGEEYHSLNEFRMFNHINEPYLRNIKKELNLSLEEAIDYILCKREQEKNEQENRRLKEKEKHKKHVEYGFVYKGVKYNSFAEAIRQLSRDVCTMDANYISTIAKKNKITKQEAIDLYLERKEKRELDFISKNQFAPHHVDIWYDRHSKNWVVQLKDIYETQIGEALYSYSKKEAITNKAELQEQYKLNKKENPL